MTLQRGLWLSRDGSNNGTAPKGARLATGGLLAHDGASALGVRAGVLWDGQGAVVAGKANMSYDVRALVAVLLPSATNGPLLVANDGTVNVVTTAAPGSNSRIDQVWVRQKLTVADGGADSANDVEFGVTQGSVSATPSAPATPAGALALANITVTSGVTATSGLTISQVHPWTAANGAPIPVRNDTERSALTAVDGMLVNHLGNDVLQRYDGTAWKDLDIIDERLLKGTIAVPSGTGLVAVNVTGLTLPDDNYVVVATPTSGFLTNWSTASYTATGFSINVVRSGAGTYSMRWILMR